MMFTVLQDNRPVPDDSSVPDDVQATLSQDFTTFRPSERFPSHNQQWPFLISTIHQSWLLIQHFYIYIYMGVGTICPWQV